MSPSTDTNHRATLERVGHDYQRKGYEFTLYPKPGELPDFLKDYGPDAVATSNAGSVVISVNRFGEEQAPLVELAGEIRRHPGWRLDVVFPEKPHPKLPIHDADEIAMRLPAARRMFDQGERAAALLLLWSLLEAATRLQLATLGVERNSFSTTTALAKDLVAHGLVDDHDQADVEDLGQLRDRLGHGVFDRDVSEEQFTRLCNIVGAVLHGGDLD